MVSGRHVGTVNGNYIPPAAGGITSTQRGPGLNSPEPVNTVPHKADFEDMIKLRILLLPWTVQRASM